MSDACDQTKTLDHLPDKERGMAMLIVLWFIVSGSIMVASFSTTARSGTQLMSSEIQISKANAALDGGLELAATHLIDANKQARWSPLRRATTLRLGDFDVTIKISDPNSSIDINKADKDILKRLFLRFAGSDQRATGMVQAILDARAEAVGSDDEGRTLQSNKMDGDNSQIDDRQGLPAFYEVSQLRHITGMTPTLYNAVAPFITVYSPNGSINPLTASNEVLATIPELTPNDIARLRRPAGNTNSMLTGVPSSAQSVLSESFGPIYVVTVAASRPPSFRTSRTYVIATDLDPDAPYRLLSKTSGAMQRTNASGQTP